MIVKVRCLCPKRGGRVRHGGGDQITLRDRLGFRGAHAIRWAISIQKSTDPNATLGETMALLSEQYVIAGVESWTLRNDEGPIEPSPANIREYLLSDLDVATVVADQADDLYGPVILPLLSGASTSSPDTPTDESTSPKTGSSEKRPTPLKPSSTTSSPTASTETTSSGLDGDFSSSPSSASAA